MTSIVAWMEARRSRCHIGQIFPLYGWWRLGLTLQGKMFLHWRMLIFNCNKVRPCLHIIVWVQCQTFSSPWSRFCVPTSPSLLHNTQSRHHYPTWQHLRFPKNNLSPGILQLHITTCYGENLAMVVVVDTTCHHIPIAKLLDMVNHDPSILHVVSTLHVVYKIDSISKKVHGHFEQKDRIFALPWKLTIMHIFEPKLVLKGHYTTHYDFHHTTDAMLRSCHEVHAVRWGERSMTSSKETPWRRLFSLGGGDLRM